MFLKSEYGKAEIKFSKEKLKKVKIRHQAQYQLFMSLKTDTG